MKNIFLFALGSAFVSAGLMAQPTLTSNSIANVGYVYTASQVNLGLTNEGISGANQTWNFSALQDTGAQNTFTLVNSNSLPEFNQFPASNLAFTGTLEDGSTFSNYLLESTGSLQLIGAAINSEFGDIAIGYTNPKTLYTLPSSYNGSMTDTYRSFYSIDFGGQGSSNASSTGNASYTVDGYGTLITSSGTYANSIRIKRLETYSDTIQTVIFGQPQEPIVSESHIREYEWINIVDGQSFPLFILRYDTTYTDADTSMFITATHNTGGTATTIASVSTTNDFMLFPNPTEGKFVATVSNQINKIEICDITGKTVQTIVPDADKLNDVQEFDITNLPAGIYWVRQMGDSGIITKKLVRR